MTKTNFFILPNNAKKNILYALQLLSYCLYYLHKRLDIHVQINYVYKQNTCMKSRIIQKCDNTI